MYSSAAVLLGALLANQVYAQNDEELETDAVAGEEAAQTESDTAAPIAEEVVVYGIKQSLQTAQDLKRDAATVVDAITASDITSLPDKSVVDALTRVPGVTVEVFEATDDPEHFGAEGSTALVRGLDRTLTQFNGRTSFSATQWGALNLSHVPSELVGAIEVQKNQTASMIEGGIAGTLNLVTRKPFDSAGMQLGGAVKVDYADVAEEWSPNISGLFSNSWDTDIGEVGFLVSLAWSETYSSSETVGVHNYYERSNRTEPSPIEGGNLDGVGVPLPGQDPNTTLWVPSSAQIRAKDDERERLGLVSSLQWRNPEDTVQATLEFIRSDGQSVWTERLAQNKDQLGDASANPDVATVLEIPGYSGVEESFDPETGLFTHGVLSQRADDEYGFAPETRYHDEDTYVNDLSLDVRWNVSDNLTINSDLQYVDSGQVMFDHTIHSYFESDIWIDVRDKDNPQIGFLGDNFHMLSPTEAATGSGSFFIDANGNSWGGDLSSMTDPENIHTRSAMDHNTDSSGEALAFSVDADYTFDEGWITNLKAGIRLSSRDQVHKSTEYDWGVISPEWAEAHRRSIAEYPSGAQGPSFQELYSFGGDFYDGDAFVDGSVTSFYVPRVEWVKNLSAFEETFRAIVPHEYDPEIAALPVSDEYPANHPARDATWEYTVAEGADTPFFTLESRQVAGKPPGSPYSPFYIFEVEEQRNAAYIQLDYDFIDLPIPIRGNVGLRYVDIDVTTIGSRVFDTPAQAGRWGAAPGYTPDTQIIGMPDDLAQYIEDMRTAYQQSQDTGEEYVPPDPSTLEWMNGYSERRYIEPKPYSKVLPSFNLTANLMDDLLARFAISRAVYIPHLSLKRASQRLTADVTLTPVPEDQAPTGWDMEGRGRPIQSVEFDGYTSTTAGGSNPYLLPEESVNIDLGLEWYFSDVGSMTGVLFTKDMDNLIRKVSTNMEAVNPLSGEEKTFEQSETYNNVGSARINGIELAYQQTYDMLPGFWSGLGVQANFTYLDTGEEIELDVEDDVYGAFTDLPLEGLSPRSYNLIVFYENENFNTRLAYNYRSKYMINARDVIGKRPVYNDDRGVLDYSFSYNVTDDINVGFDIQNLTDEQTHTMYQYDTIGSLHPRNYFYNDRRVTFRVSGSF